MYKPLRVRGEVGFEDGCDAQKPTKYKEKWLWSSVRHHFVTTKNDFKILFITIFNQLVIPDIYLFKTFFQLRDLYNHMNIIPSLSFPI